jgi:hypothetical protein
MSFLSKLKDVWQIGRLANQLERLSDPETAVYDAYKGRDRAGDALDRLTSCMAGKPHVIAVLSHFGIPQTAAKMKLTDIYHSLTEHGAFSLSDLCDVFGSAVGHNIYKQYGYVPAAALYNIPLLVFVLRAEAGGLYGVLLVTAALEFCAGLPLTKWESYLKTRNVSSETIV